MEIAKNIETASFDTDCREIAVSDPPSDLSCREAAEQDLDGTGDQENIDAHTPEQNEDLIDPVVEDRSCERDDVELAAIVQFKESSEEFWKEKIQVQTISRNGAGFRISRPVPLGRLISMALPMPEHLRVYDHGAELYAVSGLVQYCNPVRDKDGERYDVGLAFIGKKLPESYRADPRQSYRILGMGADGLWIVRECTEAYIKRKHHRYRVALPTSVVVLTSPERGLHEMGITIDVSAEGISLLSDAAALVGDRVKLTCKPLDFCGFGIVRGVSKKNHRGPCLHIQLTEDSCFPVRRVIPAMPGKTEPEIDSKGDLVTYGDVRIRL